MEQDDDSGEEEEDDEDDNPDEMREFLVPDDQLSNYEGELIKKRPKNFQEKLQPKCVDFALDSTQSTLADNLTAFVFLS